MLVDDVEAKVIAISSKSEEELTKFLLELLEKSREKREVDIDKFLSKHASYQESSLTKEEYMEIRKILAKKKIQFSVFEPEQEGEKYRLVFGFNDLRVVSKAYEKLVKKKLKLTKGIQGYIENAFEKLKNENKETLEKQVKFKEATLDER